MLVAGPDFFLVEDIAHFRRDALFVDIIQPYL